MQPCALSPLSIGCKIAYLPPMNDVTKLPVNIDARAPDDCSTMQQVREGVDAIDRQLVTLIAARQGYMHAAARIKANRDDVYDAERIEDIIEKVLELSKSAGLSADISEPVWREMIKQCIAHEFKVWDGEI